MSNRLSFPVLQAAVGVLPLSHLAACMAPVSSICLFCRYRRHRRCHDPPLLLVSIVIHFLARTALLIYLATVSFLVLASAWQAGRPPVTPRSAVHSFTSSTLRPACRLPFTICPCVLLTQVCCVLVHGARAFSSSSLSLARSVPAPTPRHTPPNPYPHHPTN